MYVNLSEALQFLFFQDEHIFSASDGETDFLPFW